MRLALLFALLGAAACESAQRSAPVEAPPTASPSPASGRPLGAADYEAVVAAPDRSAGDREIDRGRHPAELLAFLGVQRGMRIGELFAGAGYTAELLARAVGPEGVVYAENPNVVLQQVEGLFKQRLAKVVNRNIVRVDRELERPFPPDVGDLDMVVINLAYHDTVWLKVDRDQMNVAVFVALKKQGTYAIIDHSSVPGKGFAEVQTLHRIDEAAVRAEIDRAGFALQREGTFLRNPSDKRDWNDSPAAAGNRRGTSDRFALLYVKP
jgi:predicted methyltransferase